MRGCGVSVLGALNAALLAPLARQVLPPKDIAHGRGLGRRGERAKERERERERKSARSQREAGKREQVTSPLARQVPPFNPIHAFNLSPNRPVPLPPPNLRILVYLVVYDSR